MSTEGLSTALLGRLHDVMVGHVERGDVPGIVTLVCWRRGVHRDTVSRICSQDKNRPRKE
jgi:hypothetical protein